MALSARLWPSERASGVEGVLNVIKDQCNKELKRGENELTFFSDHVRTVQRARLSEAKLLAERERVDVVGHVEPAGGERLHVVHVDVADGEALAGRDVEASPDAVDLHVAVNLAALVESLRFKAELAYGHLSFALFKLLQRRIPLFFPVRIDHVLASVAAAESKQKLATVCTADSSGGRNVQSKPLLHLLGTVLLGTVTGTAWVGRCAAVDHRRLCCIFTRLGSLNVLLLWGLNRIALQIQPSFENVVVNVQMLLPCGVLSVQRNI